MNPNPQALDAYIKHMGKAEELLERLTQFVDDMGDVMPDDVNWTHVGDAAHMVGCLEQLADFVLAPEAA